LQPPCHPSGAAFRQLRGGWGGKSCRLGKDCRVRNAARQYFWPCHARGHDDISQMEQIPGLPAAAFEKADPSPDADFYRTPRFVAHIDDGAITAVTAAYRALLPPNGAILDLMSSWISHLPEDVTYASVIGHGMNAEELAANPRLTCWFVQDLNADPVLPLEDAAFDAACLCVSVQYLQRPVEVFRQVARVLRPGARLVVSFSNRCFPTKAVAIWQTLSPGDQQRLVAAYLRQAGFAAISTRQSVPAFGDPLWVVAGATPS
jgi:SAM-dependent methyltransferase